MVTRKFSHSANRSVLSPRSAAKANAGEIEQAKPDFLEACHLYIQAERVESDGKAYAGPLARSLAKNADLLERLDATPEQKAAIARYEEPPNGASTAWRETKAAIARYKQPDAPYARNANPTSPTQAAQNLKALEVVDSIVPQVLQLAEERMREAARKLTGLNAFDEVFRTAYLTGPLENSPSARSIAMEAGPDIDIRPQGYSSVRELARDRGDTDVTALPQKKPASRSHQPPGYRSI